MATKLTGRRKRATGDRPGLALIEAGEFLMGSPPDEEGRDPDEAQHPVTVDRPFWMMRTPVTCGQYESVRKELRCAERSPRFPVTQVQWIEALLFANALSEREGLDPAYEIIDGGPRRQGRYESPHNQREWRITPNDTAPGYRLPTEAEWEYAARAGTQTRFWSGDDEADLSKVGWYCHNARFRVHAVARKPANPWGLYDVHGLVWEFCWDNWTTYPGAEAHAEFDFLRSSRVTRGGSWSNPPSNLRAAHRSLTDWHFHYDYGGFRLVRNAL